MQVRTKYAMRTRYAGKNEQRDALAVDKSGVRVRGRVSRIVIHAVFTGILSFDRGRFIIAIKFEPDVYVPVTTGMSIALIINRVSRYWSSGNAFRAFLPGLQNPVVSLAVIRLVTTGGWKILSPVSRS